MQRILFSAVIASLATTLAAQTTFTTPSGYDTKTGGSYGLNSALSFAGKRFSTVRYQVTDATMPSGKMTLTQMEMRTMTSRTYATFRGQGRVINNLTLSLGNEVSTGMTQNWAKNWNGSPTKVFSSAKYSLPAYTSGTPKQVWGNTLSLSFSSSFMWDSSKGGMLQEWTTTGGVLANGWTGSSTYYLDGTSGTASGTSRVFVQPSSSSTAASRYVPKYYYNAAGGACNDSAMTNTNSSAYAWLSLAVHDDNYPAKALAGRGSVNSSWTLYTAPSAPILAMLSLGGSDTGVNAGALCNKVHVNTGFPLAIVAKKAATSTTSAFTRDYFPPAVSFGKWGPKWGGQVIYWQAAWEDSKTKAFSLTVASKLTLPSKPTGHKPAPGAAAWAYEYTIDTGTFRAGPNVSTVYNPVERWTKK